MAYQALMRHLDRAQKQKLRTAQQAWLHFRDANADFQASMVEGGTLSPLIRVTSLAEMTKTRAEELSRGARP
jgi:uncharacterized protein YecT (DUF1311 family)